MFQSHIRSLLHIENPLNDLRTKGTLFPWNHECQKPKSRKLPSFTRRRLSQSSIFNLISPQICKYMDTSAHAIGGILGQVDDALSMPVFIAFFSRQRSPVQQNFNTGDRELFRTI